MKASTRNLLNAIEIHRILETLLKAGKVSRRRAGVEEKISQEALIDWAGDAWYAEGRFW